MIPFIPCWRAQPNWLKWFGTINAVSYGVIIKLSVPDLVSGSSHGKIFWYMQNSACSVSAGFLTQFILFVQLKLQSVPTAMCTVWNAIMKTLWYFLYDSLITYSICFIRGFLSEIWLKKMTKQHKCLKETYCTLFQSFPFLFFFRFLEM